MKTAKRHVVLFAAATAWLAAACSDDATKSQGTTDTTTGGADAASDAATTGTSQATESGQTDGDTAATQTDAETTSTSTGDTAQTDTSGAATDSAADSASEWTGGNGTFACAGKIYQCGDAVDNDSDGKTDAADPDCLGPCDNNESGFQIDIPGSEPSGCSMECYFDDDNGTGNDHCDWNFLCDPFTQTINDSGKVCAFDPDGVTGNTTCDALRASQAQECRRVCEPLVPNGCDCWGCCFVGDHPQSVYIGTPGCSLDHLENCDPCEQVPSCINTCGRCELCLGKTAIPDDCLAPPDTDSAGTTDSTGTTDWDTDISRCAPGVQPCGLPGDAPCPTARYCITGCCQPILLQ